MGAGLDSQLHIFNFLSTILTPINNKEYHTQSSMNITSRILQLCIAALASMTIRGSDEGSNQSNARIIGGNVADKGRYSYAVSLQSANGHFCGGSLIAKDIVLTAAHCMQATVESGEGFVAVIGRQNLATSDGEVIAPKRIAVSDDYEWGTTDSDFAIVVLDRPTEADVNIVPITPEVVPIGSLATVVGWGDTDPSDIISELSYELLETHLYILSNERCEESSAIVGGFDFFGYVIGGYVMSYRDQITENMVCATDTGEDSCQVSRDTLLDIYWEPYSLKD